MCFEAADLNKHDFIVARQYTSSKTLKPVYTYESFATVDAFLKEYVAIKPKDRTYFELIRENRPCLEYYDIEWVLDPAQSVDQQEQAILEHILEMRNMFGPDHPVTWEQCRVSTASHEDLAKGSLHVVVFGEHAFANNLYDQLAFMKAFEAFWKAHNTVCYIDWKVYTKNRTMRCLDSAKVACPERPLKKSRWHTPSSVAPDCEFYITNTLLGQRTHIWAQHEQIQAAKKSRAFSSNRLECAPKDLDETCTRLWDAFHKKCPEMSALFQPVAVHGKAQVSLRRIPKAGGDYCPLCEREHENDNAFLSLEKGDRLEFHCWRNPKLALVLNDQVDNSTEIAEPADTAVDNTTEPADTVVDTHVLKAWFDARFSSHFTFVERSPTSAVLKRSLAGGCDVCKEVHSRAGGFMFVRKGYVMFRCNLPEDASDIAIGHIDATVIGPRSTFATPVLSRQIMTSCLRHAPQVLVSSLCPDITFAILGVSESRIALVHNRKICIVSDDKLASRANKYLPKASRECSSFQISEDRSAFATLQVLDSQVCIEPIDNAPLAMQIRTSVEYSTTFAKACPQGATCFIDAVASSRDTDFVRVEADGGTKTWVSVGVNKLLRAAFKSEHALRLERR